MMGDEWNVQDRQTGFRGGGRTAEAVSTYVNHLRAIVNEFTQECVKSLVLPLSGRASLGEAGKQ